MGKCLTTKLDGVVNNDSLEKYGKMKIAISKVSSPTQWTQGFGLQFNKDVTIKLIGDGYFTDKTLTQNLGKTLDIKANVFTAVEVSNSDCEIEIDKYSLVQFNDYGEFVVNKIDTGVKNKTIIGIEKFQYSTGLTSLNLSNTQVSGDVSKLSTLVNLTSLNLSNTQVSGDVSKLSTLVNLTYISLYNTQVSGDVSKLSTLVNLTSLSLSNTQTPIIGDISFTQGMTKLTDCSIKNSKINGDLATVPSTVRFCSFQNDAGSTFTWGSRPTSANIIAIEGNASCTNIDAMLINQAQCVKAFTSSDGSWYKAISLSGTRTSASDDAVAKLQQMGYTIAITKA